VDPYVAARFLHILGAFGLFIAMGVEWLGVSRLARAATHDDAVTWLGVASSVGRFAGCSLALVLLPGLYMAGARWGFAGWLVVALGGIVVLALLGGVQTGRTMAVLGRAIEPEQGILSLAARERLRSPTLVISTWTRTALLLGIVALMSFKPDLATSLAVLGASLVAGLALAFAVTRRPRRAVATGTA
jgi:hypothetical protein